MKTPFFLSVLLLTGSMGWGGTPEIDRRIEHAAKSSFNYRTVLEDNVRVKVLNGVVTLTGIVEDKEDRVIAEETVDNLPGVSRVENQIAVSPLTPERTDAWIALRIRRSLLVKANVSASTTKATVKDGAVTLTGTVNDAEEKELTEFFVKEIDGVKSVQNRLSIQPGASPPAHATEPIDDASVTTQVKLALSRNRSTGALKSLVVTNGGVVAVAGEARNEGEREAVTKIVQNVRGVKSVNNRMLVMTDNPAKP